MPFDAEIFEEMKNTALEVLQGREKKEYAQAVVLLTAKGKKYAAFIENAISEEKTDENNLIGRLTDANDTEIDFILCLWQNGGIDLPSYAFRKMICGLNSANYGAEIFVMTGSGYSAIEIRRTL